MNNFCSYFIFLLAVIIFQTAYPNELITYKNHLYGYEFEIPNTWCFYKDHNSGVSFFDTSIFDENNNFNLRRPNLYGYSNKIEMPTDELIPLSTMFEEMESNSTKIDNEYTSFNVIKYEYVNIDGYPFIKSLSETRLNENGKILLAKSLHDGSVIKNVEDIVKKFDHTDDVIKTVAIITYRDGYQIWMIIQCVNDTYNLEDIYNVINSLKFIDVDNDKKYHLGPYLCQQNMIKPEIVFNDYTVQDYQEIESKNKSTKVTCFKKLLSYYQNKARSYCSWQESQYSETDYGSHGCLYPKTPEYIKEKMMNYCNE